jgi:hypothetical protein
MNLQRLYDRIANDRLFETEVSEPARDQPDHEREQRRYFNAGSRHVESLVRRWADEERVLAGLAELRDAKAMDLRVKHALVETP